jgi:hypothetical protein
MVVTSIQVGRIQHMVKLLATLVLSVLLGGASAAGIYKWVDSEGKVHYGETPPPESNSQEIQLAPRPSKEQTTHSQESLDQLLEQQRRGEEIQRRSEETQRKAKAQKQQAAAERKSRCMRARQNLYVLQQQRPVYFINEKGEEVFLDDKVRAAQIQSAKEQIEAYCD